MGALHVLNYTNVTKSRKATQLVDEVYSDPAVILM